MPTQEETQKLITSLNAQHPNPWTPGAAYPAVNPFTGTQVMIRRSKSVRTRENFLHIYVPCDVVVRSPDGSELSRRPGSRHYRANLRTLKIEEV